MQNIEMNISIREAEESDLSAIEGLMGELMEAMAGEDGLDMQMVSANYNALLDDANSHFLVAETDGCVIGVITFTLYRTLLHPGLSGLIGEFVVTKNHRGRGVGKQLMYAAIEKCQQLGCCEVEVSTELSNTNARRFYKDCGFEETGVFFEKDLP